MPIKRRFSQVMDFLERHVIASEALPLEEMLEKAGFVLKDGKITEIPNSTDAQKTLKNYRINK